MKLIFFDKGYELIYLFSVIVINQVLDEQNNKH